jgi:hypothetical protein
VFSRAGWATWFPWSGMPLMIGGIGQPAITMAPNGLVVVALTSSVAQRYRCCRYPTPATVIGRSSI